MFPSSSSRHDSIRRFSPRRVFALVLLSFSLLFFACSMPGEPDLWTAEREWIKTNLDGTWDASFYYNGMLLYEDTLVISADTMSFSYKMYDYLVEGSVQKVILFDYDGKSGMIFIKYNGTQSESDGTPVIGDYVGYYFKSRTKTMLEFSAATDSNYKTPAQATLQDAINIFTVDSIGTYFSKFSTMTKK